MLFGSTSESNMMFLKETLKFLYFIQRGAFVSEPAILVKRTGKPSQVWSMDKLENKLIDMRDLYGDGKDHVSSANRLFVSEFLCWVSPEREPINVFFIYRIKMILPIHFMNTLKTII